MNKASVNCVVGNVTILREGHSMMGKEDRGDIVV